MTISRVQRLFTDREAGDMPSPLEFRDAFDADVAARYQSQSPGAIPMWDKIKTFFKDSETIFLARMQVFVGAISGLLLWIVNDPNINDAFKTIIKPQYVPFYIIGIGLLTEILRRRRAPDL